jgi:alkyl hydroperoxide reductase subunit AhpC
MLSSNLFLLACLSIAVSSVLQPRMAAPAFSAPAVLPDKSFTTIDLEDFAGKYLVAVFYPFDFTYVCPTELLSYSDRVKEFQGKIYEKL